MSVSNYPRIFARSRQEQWSPPTYRIISRCGRTCLPSHIQISTYVLFTYKMPFCTRSSGSLFFLLLSITNKCSATGWICRKPYHDDFNFSVPENNLSNQAASPTLPPPPPRSCTSMPCSAPRRDTRHIYLSDKLFRELRREEGEGKNEPLCSFFFISVTLEVKY